MRSLRSLAVSAAAIVFTGIVFIIPFLFIVLQAVKNPEESRSLSFAWPTEFPVLDNIRQVFEC
jgi:raffinose/stachyose/melibiose transport system permease protein